MFVLAAGLGCQAHAMPVGAPQPGLDMIMIDADAMPQEPEQAEDAVQIEDVSWSGAPVDLLKPMHHIYTDLRRQLIKYQNRWSSLPQVRVPEVGKALQFGASNRHVLALRQRLGLGEGAFDAELRSRVMAFQSAHGLSPTGTAEEETLASLNRGAAYYERRLLLNMERARRLPAPGTVKKYILVDAGSARLWMYENGQVVDSMKVIVGKAEDATPMMAASLRYAGINPYWNVPPDLVAKLIAPRVLSSGATYLSERRYEVLDGWTNDAKVIGPGTVDWNAVAKGTRELRVRQLPGGANSMGAIKFMMPNEYGIYLHDTPNKALFEEKNRWLSNGCVRLEDAERLARWVFGTMPRASKIDAEEYVPVQHALPVYITYLTVDAGDGGPLFRADPYNRDKAVLERFAEAGDGMKNAEHRFEIDLSGLTEPLIKIADTDESALASVRDVSKPQKSFPASSKVATAKAAPKAEALRTSPGLKRDQAPASKPPSVLRNEAVRLAPTSSQQISSRKISGIADRQAKPDTTTKRVEICPDDAVREKDLGGKSASPATVRQTSTANIDELAPRIVKPKANAGPGQSFTARPKIAD